MNGHIYQRLLEFGLSRISRPHAHPRELRITAGTLLVTLPQGA